MYDFFRVELDVRSVAGVAVVPLKLRANTYDRKGNVSGDQRGREVRDENHIYSYHKLPSSRAKQSYGLIYRVRLMTLHRSKRGVRIELFKLLDSKGVSYCYFCKKLSISRNQAVG